VTRDEAVRHFEPSLLRGGRTTYLNPSHLSSEHRGLRIVRVPVGPSAGTQERLVLVQDGELHGFDLGNQGGGQN